MSANLPTLALAVAVVMTCGHNGMAHAQEADALAQTPAMPAPTPAVTTPAVTTPAVATTTMATPAVTTPTTMTATVAPTPAEIAPTEIAPAVTATAAPGDVPPPAAETAAPTVATTDTPASATTTSPTPAPTAATPATTPGASPTATLAAAPHLVVGDDAVDSEQLGDARGGTDVHNDLSRITATGSVSDVSVSDSLSGSNLITEGAFSGTSGIPMVIQNSGNGVLIQNAVIVNVDVR